MTSNLGAETSAVGFEQTASDGTDAALKERFAPEFLSRIDCVASFRPLDGDALSAIAAAELDFLRQRAAQAGVVVEAAEEICGHLAGLCSVRKGARQIRRLIREQVEDPLTELMLSDPELRRVKVLLRGDQVTLESQIEQKTGRGVLP